MSDYPPVTAPFAWFANDQDAAPPSQAWVAHCEPVHLALARDHLVPVALGDAPVSDIESRELLASARLVLQGTPFHMEEKAGRWFLVGTDGFRPDLTTLPLDAVLGRPLQDRMPTGADAGRWRRIDNEIQMQWHASAANSAREERGVRTVNGVWVHGGGTWQDVLQAPFVKRVVDPATMENAVLNGWTQATPLERRNSQDVLSVNRALLSSFQAQAWESWVGAFPGVQARVEADMQEAARLGAQEFELVLTGAHSARSFCLPLRKRRWPWQRRHDAQRTLRENLAEPEMTEPNLPHHA
jgi:hypothetical protein